MNTLTTVDISGFGGGYEATCQRMLWNGIYYLENGGAKEDLQVEQFQNVTGIATATSENAKLLETAMMTGVEDCTGAMHQCTLNHLLYIAKHGREAWLKRFVVDVPHRVYQIDPITFERIGPTDHSPPIDTEKKRSQH